MRGSDVEIKTLDGIDIYVLPDNACCCASDESVSPTELLDCPLGNNICHPDGCVHYDEITEIRE